MCLAKPEETEMRLRLLAAFFALLLVAGACGHDSGDDTAEDTAAPETTEAVDDTAAEEADGDSEDSLLAGVPEVADATQDGQETVQEGGVHIFGPVEGDPDDIVADYEEALEANGWRIEGTGEDPTGQFGAGVQATAEDGRYLNFNVGGRGQAGSFGDLCVWPSEPADATCGADEDLQEDYDPSGPPPGVEGFIPDEVEGTDA